MPDAARAVSGIPRANPGGRVIPRFVHRLIRFRHFIDGLLALASLDLAVWTSCPDLTATLTTSCASPFGPATLVTHDPQRTLSDRAAKICLFDPPWTFRSVKIFIKPIGFGQTI